MDYDFNDVFTAIAKGDLEQVKKFFDLHEDAINHPHKDLCMTPLFFAVAKSKSEIVDYMFDHKNLNLRYVNQKGQNIVDYACDSFYVNNQVVLNVYRKYYKIIKERSCLLHAAKTGNFDEGEMVLRKNPDSITEVDDMRMNAIQISITQMHEEFSLYLLSHTEISVLNKDKLGRDALDLAILFGSDKLCEEVNKVWNQQWAKKIASENKKIEPFTKPPKL